MKLNYLRKGLSTLGRFLATTLFCLSAIAFWQGAFLNTTAMASPAVNLIATADAGDKVKEKTSEGFDKARDFIQDSKNKVEQTARTNASKVDQADDSGSFVEGKAKRDAARIHERAEEDAARTQKAVDKSQNFVESTIEGIKDALSK